MAASICFGTRLLTVGKTDTRASLLVEFTDDSANPNLELKLATATNGSYKCTIVISDISSCNLGEQKDSEKLKSLGRLLLREETDDESSDDKDSALQNLTTTFQYKNDDNKLVFLIHDNLSNGMKRRILEKPLACTESQFEYSMAVGTALNSALQQVQTLSTSRDHWKTTATDLSEMQERHTSTLLANFTKLRNTMVENHARKIAELQEAHKVALKAASKKAVKREEAPPTELFDNDQVLALAQGRKFNTSADADASARTTTINAKRSVLPTVDMVQIRNQGLEYQRSKPQKLKIRQGESLSEGSAPTPFAKKRRAAPKTRNETSSKKQTPPPAATQTSRPTPQNTDDRSTASESSWTLR